MSEKEPTPESARSKKKLKVEKRPVEEQPDDLAVNEEEAEDVKGGVGKRGFAPPYVPVGPDL
jgi:hypothetical protein